MVAGAIDGGLELLTESGEMFEPLLIGEVLVDSVFQRHDPILVVARMII